ncbi:hypothetical protein MNBD_BACTEROID05-77 [hydrothermal vent metagenome]|uniref:O-antigen ligase-related domain-containing protein n=1 Tax=hydrothermal vent metagenome TaxID=652676 RepID=A0A3B0THJ5_9ZZZZ
MITALFLWIIKRGYLFWHKVKRNKKSPWNVFKNSFCPKPCFLNKPIVAFLFFGSISTAVNSGGDFLLGGFLTKTCEWFIIFWLFLEVFTEKKHVFIALKIFTFTAFLTSIDSLVQFYWLGYDIVFHHPLDDKGFSTAAFDYANSLGGYLTIAVPLFFSFCFYFRKDKLKLFFAVGLFFATIFSIFVTFSRSSWLALLVGFSLFFIFAGNRKVLGVYLLVVVLISGLFFSVFSKNISSSSKLNIDKIQSMAQWRIGIWEDSFKMIKEKPFLGHGPNTYMEKFQKYRRKKEGIHPYSPAYAHNGYIQLGAELGVFALVSFLWITFSLFNRGASIIKNAIDYRDKDTIILAGLLSGCGAFLVHAFFDNNFYSLQLSAHIWISVGLAVAFMNLIKKHTEKTYTC